MKPRQTFAWVLCLLPAMLTAWACLSAGAGQPAGAAQAAASTAAPATPSAAPPATPAATEPAGAEGSTVQITILHVNDTHGRTGPRPSGPSGGTVGGYAKLATLVAQVRASSPAKRVVLVHCGDILSRGDALTRRTMGQANFTLLNLLKFDAWTPGNGDFYDGLPVLRRLIQQAKFPTLTANVQVAGKCLARPYVIEQAGPVKVAFFGLCTTDSDPAANLAVLDPQAVAKDLVPRLREQADVVVACTHLGFFKDLALAGGVEGLDLILGGHTHTVLPTGMPVRGPGGQMVLVCQTGDYLRYLGRVDLTVQRLQGRYRLTGARAVLIPLDEKVPADPAIEAKILKMSGARKVETQPAAAAR